MDKYGADGRILTPRESMEIYGSTVTITFDEEDKATLTAHPGGPHITEADVLADLQREWPGCIEETRARRQQAQKAEEVGKMMKSMFAAAERTKQEVALKIFQEAFGEKE